MRKAEIFVNQVRAGILEEVAERKFLFNYYDDYKGAPVSLTMPTKKIAL